MERNEIPKREDIRVVKSKRLLRNTLTKLLEQESFSKITVKNICDNAGVNRMTFYKHYKDKYELFNDCLVCLRKNIYADVNKEVTGEAPGIVRITKTINASIYAIVFTADKYRKTIKALFMGDEPIAIYIFISQLIKCVEDLLDTFTGQVTFAVSRDVVSGCIMGALTKILFDWLKEPKGKTKEELVGELQTIAMRIHSSSGGVFFNV